METLNIKTFSQAENLASRPFSPELLWAFAISQSNSVSWRKATFPPTSTPSEFEIQCQKDAFIQKVVEVIRKGISKNSSAFETTKKNQRSDTITSDFTN